MFAIILEVFSSVVVVMTRSLMSYDLPAPYNLHDYSLLDILVAITCPTLYFIHAEGGPGLKEGVFDLDVSLC